MEYHKQNKKFPGIGVKPKRNVLPLMVLWTNFFIVGVPFIYVLLKVFTSGNLPLIVVTSLFIIIGKTSEGLRNLPSIWWSTEELFQLIPNFCLIVYIALYLAIRSAKIAKASPYGTTEGKPNTKTKTSLKDTINTVVNGINHSKEE